MEFIKRCVSLQVDIFIEEFQILISVLYMLLAFWDQDTEMHLKASHMSLFPGGSDGEESACSAGDLGSISGLGRSLGEAHDNSLQYSSLENLHG